MPTGDRQLVGMLQQAIEESDFAWSLCLIGEDQSHKLAALTGDLRGKPSNTGDGKQISSGFAYWGIAPTIAWGARLQRPVLPGDAAEHRVVLPAVDMSAEMLRLGLRESLKGVRIARRQVVPMQLDFAIEENLDELRTLMHRLVGDEPILFSLLGNTLANFEHDLAVLGKLTGLFRPQDRFLLEVATTEALGEEQAAGAADEYPQRGSGGGASGRGCGGLAPTKHSRAYQEFVTSALLHYTDLTINMDSVLYRGAVEGDRALRVKVIYQNQTGGDIRLMLPDRTRVAFPDRDTIRLYLSRKYARHELDGTHSGFASHLSAAHGFGMDLLLFAAGPPGSASRQRSSRADEIWSSAQP